MKFVFAILSLWLFACNCDSEQKTNGHADSLDTIECSREGDSLSVNSVPAYAQKIINAYPDFRIRYTDGCLVFTDGTRITCDDGKTKSFIEKLDNCDVEDMFSMTYDTTATTPLSLSIASSSTCFPTRFPSSRRVAR